MDTLAKRVKAGRARYGLSQQEVADASGLRQPDVSKIERGDILKTTGLLGLARALHCNPNWLDTGDGDPEWAPVGQKNRPPKQVDQIDNVGAVSVRKTVPLISWIKAGSWGEVTELSLPGEVDDWIDVYETQPGAQAFALRVTGDSMTSPYPGDPLTFPDGTIIIVDPERASDAGDFVVAKDVATQMATFKRLVHDGGRWFLKPLNPSYPTLEIDDPAIRVIGRVVEYRGKGGKL